MKETIEVRKGPLDIQPPLLAKNAHHGGPWLLLPGFFNRKGAKREKEICRLADCRQHDDEKTR